MTCVNEIDDADALVTIEVTRITLRRDFESAVSSMPPAEGFNQRGAPDDSAERDLPPYPSEG